jgi:hypothetical protein
LHRDLRHIESRYHGPAPAGLASNLVVTILILIAGQTTR